MSLRHPGRSEVTSTCSPCGSASDGLRAPHPATTPKAPASTQRKSRTTSIRCLIESQLQERLSPAAPAPAGAQCSEATPEALDIDRLTQQPGRAIRRARCLEPTNLYAERSAPSAHTNVIGRAALRLTLLALAPLSRRRTNGAESLHLTRAARVNHDREATKPLLTAARLLERIAREGCFGRRWGRTFVALRNSDAMPAAIEVYRPLGMNRREQRFGRSRRQIV